MAATLPLVVSLALLTGACAKAEDPISIGSGAAGADDTLPPPAESASTQPATTPRPTDPPLAPDPPPAPHEPAPPAPPDPPPDPPPAAEEPAPPATTDASAAAAATTEVTPEPIDPPEPSPANEPPDEDPTTSQEPVPAVNESLPGEPFEYGPDEGTQLSVVGVPQLPLHDIPSGQIIATMDISNPYESLLEVRDAPSGEFIASMDSPTDGIVATGRTRRLPDAEWPEAVWNEVHVAGLTGWARAAHLAPTGLTDDVTAHLIDLLGKRPVADTLIDLALIVGGAMATEEPRSLVHTVTRPIVFEGLGEVTVDVLNIGDDSLAGLRLHVFAVPEAEDWMSEDPGPFTLRTVERTIICHSHRGVTADGLCV